MYNITIITIELHNIAGKVLINYSSSFYFFGDESTLAFSWRYVYGNAYYYN